MGVTEITGIGKVRRIGKASNGIIGGPFENSFAVLSSGRDNLSLLPLTRTRQPKDNPMKRLILLPLLFSVSSLPGPEPAGIRKDIAIVSSQGTGSAAGRAAWDRLAGAGPEAVPFLLEAMDTRSLVTANWLFTALDRIVAMEKAPPPLVLDRVLDFARDPKKQGRARRVAMEIVERHRPGSLTKLLPGWLGDPEFQPEALELVVLEAKKSLASGNKERASEQYRRAFLHSRDIEQARKAAAPLLDLGLEVSIAQHLGFLTEWHLLGPFDSRGNKGYHLSYPPEKKVDLKETVAEGDKRLAWKKYSVQEPSPKVSAKHVALVNLREARGLGDADDAVAFAYTEFTLPTARRVEFRGAADDNFTVWVNGKRAFGFEEYRNGVRFDRHCFPVELQAGRNIVLVKIGQTPAPNPEPNWEFFLRIVDEEGHGVAVKYSVSD